MILQVKCVDQYRRGLLVLMNRYPAISSGCEVIEGLTSPICHALFLSTRRIATLQGCRDERRKCCASAITFYL
jgi:hypothetical protein